MPRNRGPKLPKPKTKAKAPSAAKEKGSRARVGYSGKALYEKLGLRKGGRLHLISAPQNYFVWLELERSDLELSRRSAAMEPFIHLFLHAATELESEFGKALDLLASDGTLWVSWRKGKKDGLGDVEIQNWGLAHGLVDVKVAAVSEEWSALKFVKRKKA